MIYDAPDGVKLPRTLRLGRTENRRRSR